MHVLALERGLVQSAEDQRRRVWGRTPDTVRTRPAPPFSRADRTAVSAGGRPPKRPQRFFSSLVL